MSYPVNMDERAREIHQVARAKGFWDHQVTVVRDSVLGDVEARMENPSIFEEKLALIHSEVSEILEARRDGDETLEAEECADVLIRTLDYMAARGFNPDHEVRQKMAKNQGRPYMHGRGR